MDAINNAQVIHVEKEILWDLVTFKITQCPVCCSLAVW